MPSASPSAAKTPLVSITSILILSGFLVVAPLAEIVAAELSPFITACGLVGILAFIGLQLASERRDEQSRIACVAKTHRRLDKHLTTQLVPPISLDFDGDPLADLFSSSAVINRRADDARISRIPVHAG